MVVYLAVHCEHMLAVGREEGVFTLCLFSLQADARWVTHAAGVELHDVLEILPGLARGIVTHAACRHVKYNMVEIEAIEIGVSER